MADYSRPGDSDFLRIAEIHSAAFPDFFLTRLGRRLLAVYYRDLSLADDNVFIVVRDGDLAIGFACGCADPIRFNKTFIRRRAAMIAAAAFYAAFRHPGFLSRLLTRRKDLSHFPREGGVLSLLSIAVDPALSGRGLGKALIAAFLKGCEALGVASVYLTTAKANNDPVNSFYTANGFSLVGSYDSGNSRIMNEYRIDIPKLGT